MARTHADPIPPAELDRFSTETMGHAHHLLGAHVGVVDGESGTRFAVWAPGAEAVSVIGSFNDWDRARNPLERRGGAGVWEGFIPGARPGDLYKYAITGYRGQEGEKADPYGLWMEMRPNTASRIWDRREYRWNDGAWMAGRADRQRPDRPMSVYEVHLGSWRRGPEFDPEADVPGWLDYDALADTLLPYVRDLGFTHLQLLPVTEHPYDPSWGYQSVGYFAPTSRFGDPDGFKRFVDRAHAEGLGVLLDWVPAHFPRDAHGLVYFDGTHLYEHADPRQGHHPDWGTLIFNYGRAQVASFLLSSALHWIEEFHVDGLRVDAVASMLYLDYSRDEGQWVPNRYGGRENLEAIEFLKRLNHEVHSRHPGVLMIGEESTAWPRVTGPISEGGLGFDYKWNMGWMHDTLEYMKLDPLFRSGNHNKLTFGIHYAWSERFLLPLSHDEVVHGKASLLGKMPGSPEARFANLRLLYGFMFAHPGKTLLFMGAEFGPWREWTETGELEWGLLEHEPHARLQAYVRRLNELASSIPALHQLDDHPDGFRWIEFEDAASSVVTFLRRGRDPEDLLVGAANFTPVPREGYRIEVPRPGAYDVVLNSEAVEFGGEGAGSSTAQAVGSEPPVMEVDLPPLGVLWLRPAPRSAPES